MSGFAADFIKPYSRGGEAGKWTPLQPSGQRPVKPENLSPTDYPTNTLAHELTISKEVFFMQTRPFSPDIIFTSIPALLPYLAVTLVVGVTSILTGSIIGMLLAWAKLSGHKAIRALADGYTYIIRCTPSIVLLFIVFYGLPKFMEAEFGIDMDNLSRAIFVIITFTFLFGAYVSEVFRSAYETVDRGQYEAAVTIGLSPEQAFFRVMLPQAAVIALPNFGNSVINLMKESALAYTIGLIDLLGRTNLIISKNYGAYGVELYVACLLIYWGLSFLIEQAFLRMESYLGRGRLKA